MALALARSYSGAQVSANNQKKRQLLQRAEGLVGRERLAKRLGISETMLDAWIRGDTTMPDGKLLDLAAALMEVANRRDSS
jgi:hypothetical protein